MFTQLINPLGNLTLTCIVALVPVVSLFVLLAVCGLPAWLATLLGSISPCARGVGLGDAAGRRRARLSLRRGDRRVERRLDSFWGMVLFNTLTGSGVFENFRRWLIAQGSWTCGCRPCCSPGRSARCSRAWSDSVTPGRWSRDPDLARLSTSMRSASPRSPITRLSPTARWPPIIAIAAVTGYPLLHCPARSGRSSPCLRCCRRGSCSTWLWARKG